MLCMYVCMHACLYVCLLHAQVPLAILEHLPSAVRDSMCSVDPVTGATRTERTSFLVLDYHPCTLTTQLNMLPRPLPFATLIRFLVDLLRVRCARRCEW